MTDGFQVPDALALELLDCSQHGDPLPPEKKKKGRNRMTILGVATPKVIGHFAPEGDYKDTRTKFTTRIETELDSVVFTDRYIGQGLLKIISQVRIEVLARYNADEITPCQVAPEYRKAGSIPTRQTQAMEVDISRAYLTAAFKLGAISERTYNLLESCAKDTRLMALGSLATVKTVSLFLMGAQVETETKQDQNLTEVWKWIVSEVDKTMREVAATLRKGFLYYWCDAVMVRPELAQAAQDALKERGYGSKNQMVSIRQDGKKVYIMRPGGKEQPFPMKGIRA